MGSHVSASPNHQLCRHTSLETRANVAYFGTFGYELDLTELSEEELLTMKGQISFMKRYRELIQGGVFYRIKNPFEHNSSAWMVVSKDQTEALAAYFRVLQPTQAGFERIRLAGLRADWEYAVTEEMGGELPEGTEQCLGEDRHFGDELMYGGLSVSDVSSGLRGVAREKQGDFLSRLFHLKKI